MGEKVDILTECAGRTYDFSWLPQQIESFKLVVDTKQVDNTFLFFHYENELGWKWQALYDKEVDDYTVHVIMPLFYFVDISFIRTNWDDFLQGLQERAVEALRKRLIAQAELFTYEYKKTKILDWDYSKVMPSKIDDFVLDITPHNAISMINGSFIIGEYRRMDDASGLLFFYNVLREEFFAELRIHNVPEISHHFDGRTVQEFEDMVAKHLHSELESITARL
ncbi:hypothetical protein [uncultured Veillonella sp.]|uniref:hypothetical protein n=1 Tax=uncultured Veillonella sp. TaxID=159268 RepID=UPI0025D96DDA|nr:hypothetical protein [uncultured Veillonella sp.]MDY3973357.1 hypothetical protein [Veillonella caviae]